MIAFKNSVGEISHSVTYLIEDQLRFAQLSGDFNPIHIDHVTSRRELFGEIVVHGIHLVLEALNLVVEYSAKDEPICLHSVKVKFFNPAFISKLLKFTINNSQHYLKVEVRDQKGLLLAEMAIEVGLIPVTVDNKFIALESFDATIADNHSLYSISSISGDCKLYLNEALFNALFPCLLKRGSGVQLAELLAMTRIVGMKCPGLQSLFSGIDLKFEQNRKESVLYQVKKVIEKFSIITLQVEGPSLYGELLTLFRPLKSQQPSIEEVAVQITSGCFRNLKALIVGGSRGIGETTAKLIAAGGGTPIITYHTGKEDAETICKEIRKDGFSCTCVHMSIDNLEESLDILSEANVNAIFYYPSPKILGSNVFDKELFRKFCYYYVEQFSALIKEVKSRSTGKVVVFYPSTVYIDEKTPGLTEYIMAKGAGEYLCETLNKELKDINIYIERLPRLQTDQTLNMQNYPAQSVSEVMFPILVEINTLLV